MNGNSGELLCCFLTPRTIHVIKNFGEEYNTMKMFAKHLPNYTAP
jgi:hypothetical protein